MRFTDISKRSTAKKFLAYTREGFDYGLDFTTNYAEYLAEFITSESLKVGPSHFLANQNKKESFAVVVKMIRE